MKYILALLLIVASVACAPLSTLPAGMDTPPGPQTRVVPIGVTSTQASATPYKAELAPTTERTPTKAANRTATPTPTPSSTPTSDNCLELLLPANGTNLPPSGHVTFQWQSRGDARSYVLTLTFPTGIRETAQTTDTKLIRFVKTTDKAVAYQWSVSAYDSQSKQICSSGVFTFSKRRAPTPGSAVTMIVLPTIVFVETPTLTRRAATATIIVVPPITFTSRPTETPAQKPTLIVLPTVQFTPTNTPRLSP